MPKSQLRQALGYLRNHWDPLRVYLADGSLPIDTTIVGGEPFLCHHPIG